MSGTVVPPGRRLPSGRALFGLGGGDFETWKSCEDATATREGSAVAVHDACTTRKKNPVTVVRFLARAIQKPVHKRADDPKGTYGSRRVELHFETSHLQKTHTSATVLLLS